MVSAVANGPVASFARGQLALRHPSSPYSALLCVHMAVGAQKGGLASCKFAPATAMFAFAESPFAVVLFSSLVRAMPFAMATALPSLSSCRCHCITCICVVFLSHGSYHAWLRGSRRTNSRERDRPTQPVGLYVLYLLCIGSQRCTAAAPGRGRCPKWK